MSILLIGQHYRLPYAARPSFIDHQPDLTQEKRISKEQYRNQLLTQIKERQQRRKREKSKELEEDLKYERLFQEKTTQNNRNNSIEMISPKANSQHNEQYSSYQPNNNRYRYSLLPPINNDQSHLKPRLATLNNEDYPQDRYRQRMKTQIPYQRQSYDEYRLFFDSAELRQKKLREQLDIKIHQVYNMMANSIDPINEAQQLEQINSKFSPIKLNMDKHYKVKYHDGTGKEEEYRNYYRLPNINKSFKTEEQDADWKEWYAKEKLRQQDNHSNELVNRYRKGLENRIKTPSFNYSKA